MKKNSFLHWLRKKRIARAIRVNARRFNFSPEIIASIIWHESAGGQVYAERFEPHWYKRLVPLTRDDLKTFGFVPPAPPGLDQEKRGRSTSYGLMQILGQTAREQGFRGRFMSELFNIETNIFFGCKILNAKRGAVIRKGRPKSDEELVKKILLAYNGGGNPDYPDYIATVRESRAYEALL